MQIYRGFRGWPPVFKCHTGVRVIETAMVEKIMASSRAVSDMLENLSPMGRMATPHEMAEAAIWLCSDKSSFVNAHALVVDGGSLGE